LFGALFGSFLNVVIHRLPRNESIVFPASRCPHCGNRVRPWDNIPVVSWLILGGRCRDCRKPIAIRYPLVEAASALLVVACVARWGLTPTAAIHAAFCLSMLVITLIDLDHRIIPDSITLPGTVLALLLVNWTEPTWLDALIGAAAGFLVLYGVGEAYHRSTGIEGMGGGDIKMAAYMGAMLGWKGVLLTIFLGALLGSVAGVGTMMVGKGHRRTALPFGTFLAPAAVIALFFGQSILDAYFRLIFRG
jgi:leader peptidase (prepilin peptidase)/N-methyltransferase